MSEQLEGRAKVLFLDLENSPNTSYTWGKYDQNVVDFEEEWYLLTAAWKWQGEKKVHVKGLLDYKRHKNHDYYLVKELWNLFDQADIIVAYNGAEHDIKKANTRFALYGFPPPSPYRVYDPIKLLRSKFGFNSNKLADIADRVGKHKKLKHEGFSLWKGCMAYNPASFTKMKRYNAQDVVVLEEIYDIFKPWDAYHPNITLGTGQALLCPVCGSRTERRGWRNLKTYRARIYHCLNPKCRRYSTGEREKLKVQVLS